MVHPIVSLMGSSVFIAVEYFYNCFVHLLVTFCFCIEDQLFIKRFEFDQSLLRPAFDGRGGGLYVFPGEVLLLAVQWKVICIFLRQDHRQQACSGDTFVDHALGKFSYLNAFPVFGYIFIADIAYDIEFGGLAFEFFGNLFSDAYHIRQVSFGVYLDLVYGNVFDQLRTTLMVGAFASILDLLLDFLLLLLYFYI